MGTIDVGVTGWTANHSGYYTIISADNPANATGKITKIQVCVCYGKTLTVKFGVFYKINGNTLKCRSASDQYGPFGGGACHWIEDLDLEIHAGDYLGAYKVSGGIAVDTSGGGGAWDHSGNHCVVDNVCTYTFHSGWKGSTYGEGTTPPPPGQPGLHVGGKLLVL
jgi:hypothetical protein